MHSPLVVINISNGNAGSRKKYGVKLTSIDEEAEIS